MKNLIKVAFVFAASVMILASCSKDQKCVNWLEGDWSITAMTVTDSTGTTTDAIAAITALGGTFSGKMTFEKYSVKKDDAGNSTAITAITILGQTQRDTTSGQYKIADDCTTVSMKESTATTWDNSTILEASKTKMVIQTVDGRDTTKVTIEKQ